MFSPERIVDVVRDTTVVAYYNLSSGSSAQTAKHFLAQLSLLYCSALLLYLKAASAMRS